MVRTKELRGNKLPDGRLNGLLHIAQILLRYPVRYYRAVPQRLCRPSGTGGPFRYRQPSTKVLGYFQRSLRDKMRDNPCVPHMFRRSEVLGLVPLD